MTVARFESPSLYGIAQARNAAKDLGDPLLMLQKKACRAQHDVMKARSLEKVLLAYVKWLSAWHSAELFTTWTMHFSGKHLSDGRHVVAALGIKQEIGSVERLIAGKTHWTAVPKLEATRGRVIALLSLAISSIDNALSQCTVLAGGTLEGKSA